MEASQEKEKNSDYITNVYLFAFDVVQLIFFVTVFVWILRKL